jgi:two-component system response regulator TctD
VPEQQNKACGVLIVEDDHMTRLALAGILTRLGYRVNAAETVAQGLEGLDGQKCAILDLNLPDGLGTTVLERIRSDNRPMRVAIATGTVDEQLLAEAKKLRPDLLLRKPFDMNVLLAWLEASG